MRKSLGCSLAYLAVAIALTLPVAAAQGDQRALAVGHGERLLVVAPHPDDETLGAGGLVQRVHAQSGSVRIVLITAGDGYVEAVVHETGKPRPRPAEYIRYGERRLLEARAAARQLAPDGGVRLQFLGFPDSGLEVLLRAHWWRSRPERSATTHAADPPYVEALEPECPYDGDDLRRELGNILREFQPMLIAFPDPHDVHPDHHASGLFTMLAITDWLGEVKEGAAEPRLLSYLIHWPDWPTGWQTPVPQPQADRVPLELPPQLQQEGAVRILTLTDQELATKRAALGKHVTQQERMATFLAAFVRRTEPFRLVTYRQVQREVTTIERHIPRTPGYHDTTGSPAPGTSR